MHCKKSATEKRQGAYAKDALRKKRTRQARGKPMIIEINIKNLPVSAVAKVDTSAKQKQTPKTQAKRVVKQKSPNASPAKSVNSNVNKFSNSNSNRNIYN